MTRSLVKLGSETSQELGTNLHENYATVTQAVGLLRRATVPRHPIKFPFQLEHLSLRDARLQCATVDNDSWQCPSMNPETWQWQNEFQRHIIISRSVHLSRARDWQSNEMNICVTSFGRVTGVDRWGWSLMKSLQSNLRRAWVHDNVFTCDDWMVTTSMPLFSFILHALGGSDHHQVRYLICCSSQMTIANALKTIIYSFVWR